MRRLSSRKAIFRFSKDNKAAYRVADGETVIIETRDAFSNIVKDSQTIFEHLSMDVVNPATGPIEVAGLRSGETLCISIKKIDCGARGVVMCTPELGILRGDVRRSRTKLVPIKKKKAQVSDDLAIELNPHVGVIGVSPQSGEFPTFYPGDFGGNMDTVEASEGSKVYLPAFVDGGMVAIGDVHAAMGDGEVCGTGLEVPAEVTVTFSRRSDIQIERPMIETPTSWITYAAARTLDEAAKVATSDMVRFIMNSRGIDFEEAYMLASLVANVRVSQVVDPLVSAKMVISKKYL